MRNVDIRHWEHKGFEIFKAEHPKLIGKYEVFTPDEYFIGRVHTLEEARQLIDTKIKMELNNDTMKLNTKDLIVSNQGSMRLFSVPYLISRDDALRLQLQAGYNPQGYGFYAFTPTKEKTTWKCGNSCD